jgi:hypothetical protein
MQELKVTHLPEVSEYVATNGDETTVMYVRANSTAIVKERNGQLLECQSFGSGPMQAFREMFLKEHPPTDAERVEKIMKGVKK